MNMAIWKGNIFAIWNGKIFCLFWNGKKIDKELKLYISDSSSDRIDDKIGNSQNGISLSILVQTPWGQDMEVTLYYSSHQESRKMRIIYFLNCYGQKKPFKHNSIYQPVAKKENL